LTDTTKQDKKESRESSLEEKQTMEETESMLKAEFQTQLSESDLIDFKLYHNYHSIDGIMKLIFGLFTLAICGVSVSTKHVNEIYVIIMGLLGLFFTIYPPVAMILKVKKQMKKIPVFRGPVKYLVTEEKITMFQGEVCEELLWDDVVKIRYTGRSLILYGTTVRANIIPLKDLGRQAEAFLVIAGRKLKAYQMKIDIKKIIRRADKS
jgi:hypothetical protein